MPANATGLLSLTTEMTPVLLISFELYLLISRICYYILYPCIGLTGILGNAINIVILTRQGFRKCSSILILSLAVSDCLLLIGVNNIILHIEREYGGFRFSKTLNFVCFALSIFCFCANDLGSISSVIIPVLITGERILAIFYPFQAYAILTPRRTVIVVSCLYTVAGMFCLYGVILSFQLKYFLVDGAAVGRAVPTDMRNVHDRSGVTQMIEQIANYLTGVLPLSLVTVGCVVIGLRIVQITNRRRQLTSSQITASTKHGITKTTKTLLKICLLYIVCYGSTFIASVILQSKLLEKQRPTQLIINHFDQVVLGLNSIGNFLIYLDAHPGFWKSIIDCRRIQKSRQK